MNWRPCNRSMREAEANRAMLQLVRPVMEGSRYAIVPLSLYISWGRSLGCNGPQASTWRFNKRPLHRK